MGLLLPLIIIFSVTFIIVYFIRHLLLRDQLKDINQPRSYPLIGHALITKPDPEGFISQVMGLGYLYPEVRMILMWLGPLPALMVYSAEFVEPILSSSRHLNKGFAYVLLEPWLGLSLLTSPASRWRPKRKLLTPSFHYDILKDFVPVFNEQSRILIRKLEALPTNEPVEVLSTVTLCTLDIICETSMGRSVDAQLKTDDNEYVWAVHTINDCIQERIKNPLLWPTLVNNTFGKGKLQQKCIDILHNFTKQVIEERRADLEATEWRFDGRRAFLDLLLEMAHNGQIDVDDIQAEVDTFMFEGHDTTSTAVTWALHLIGNYPEVQKKVHEELDEVMGGRDDVTLEDLSQLKYLECCIKESLRLYPSVPIILRELGSDQKIGGVNVPKGTTVVLNQYLVHRDPSQWEDAEEFIPERFLPENSVGRHSFAFIPFSAGSRNCIGQRFALMEEKVILTWILRHFSVTSMERRFEARPKIELIIRPMDGIHVKLERRVRDLI